VAERNLHLDLSRNDQQYTKQLNMRNWIRKTYSYLQTLWKDGYK